MGRDHGPEALRSALEELSRYELRALAQAAGLRVRKHGTATWLPMGELRTALLEHLAPLRAAAPQEFAAFALFCVACYLCLSDISPHTTRVRLVSRATGSGGRSDYIGCFECSGFLPTGAVRGLGVHAFVVLSCSDSKSLVSLSC